MPVPLHLYRGVGMKTAPVTARWQHAYLSWPLYNVFGKRRLSRIPRPSHSCMNKQAAWRVYRHGVALPLRAHAAYMNCLLLGEGDLTRVAPLALSRRRKEGRAQLLAYVDATACLKLLRRVRTSAWR